ncbi:MAG: hypothetical protein A3I03_10305 [Candidatus Rokubacteria bacterium RIFCSPLOWO2_02_FULL_68_19]|nr:MAG: hypothetical protein A3I03_10305 [Candidatus Rokubacteria bacterium RIFCSPLOWO2_02_FULL_68_19]
MKQPVHVRTIRVEAIETGPGELEVTGTLLDERPRGEVRWEGDDGARVVHDMMVTLRVRYPDFVITHASGTMAAHPYTLCPEALLPLDQLVGLSVARGFVRAVQERLGRERGCSHLTALILAMAPVVKQGAGAAFRGERDAPQNADDLWFIDTCQAWRKDGPLHSLLKRGDSLAELFSKRRPPRG